MDRVNIQEAIEKYHQMMKEMGMDMHAFHANWHHNNRDPQRPNIPDANWGVNNNFGRDFLQMHHEMVKSRDDEQKYFMHHQSIVSWFESNKYDLPSEWNPLTPIPGELAFNPKNSALKRRTENPQFQLPKYFTLEGIGTDEEPELRTRARKLSDFINVNQLGCCIVFPHNTWHNKIGGAMLSFNTAIDDPIFYFGVHSWIDKVFDLYKSLPRSAFVERSIPAKFTQKELYRLKIDEEISLKIWKNKN